MSEFIHYDTCPLCGGSDLEPAIECRDDLVSHEDFTIVRCTACGFLITQDAPTEEAMHRYYATENYMPHDTRNRGWVMHLAASARRFIRLPGKRRLIERVTKRYTGHLLDIGCGSGEFPLMMQQAGWQVSAIEQNRPMREHCRRIGIDCRGVMALYDFPAAQFQAITLWHVLEHVHDLHGTMDQIRRLLAPDGRVIIAIPNIGGPLMRYYGIHDVPRHLWHFHPHTLKHLAQEHRLQVERMQPLYLDPLYMGLYYERLLHGIALRGLMIGLMDLFYGILRPRHAASLVYVLRPVTGSIDDSASPAP